MDQRTSRASIGGASVRDNVLRRAGKETKKHEKKVEDQAIDAWDSTSIWSAVKSNDKQRIFKMIETDPKYTQFDFRGRVGETILHLAFLYGHFDLAKDIMIKAPVLIPAIYEGGMYHGENCLHIAIVNKNFEMIKLLCETEYKESLFNDRCNGTFFQPGAECYFGESVLFFAVATNQPEVVRYLVEKGANFSFECKNGDNIFHIAVRQNLPEMYTLLLELYETNKLKKEVEQARFERLQTISKGPMKKSMSKIDIVVPTKYLGKKEELSILHLYEQCNKEEYSPFTLSAKLGIYYSMNGNSSMFNYMLERRKIIQWEYGPVSCKLQPIRGFDSRFSCEEPLGALDVLIEYEHKQLFHTPDIFALLSKKWDSVFEKLFIFKFVYSIFFLLLFMATTIQQVRLSKSTNKTYKSIDFSDGESTLLFFLEAILILFVILRLTMKTIELRKTGFYRFFCISGAPIFENYCTILSSVLILIGLACKYIGLDATPEFMAIATIIAWVYLLFFFLGFQTTGPFVVMIYKMIVRDMFLFIMIFLIFFFGFGHSFYLLSVDDNYGVVLQKGILTMIGEWSFFGMDNIRSPFITLCLLIAYVAMSVIMMLNLLIAMMADTYHNIRTEAYDHWLLEWSRIMSCLEIEVAFSREKVVSKYSTLIGGRKFLLLETRDDTWYHINSKGVCNPNNILGRPHEILKNTKN